MMRLLRTAGAMMLTAALVAGCGDSNDPAEFDPVGMTGDFDAVAATVQSGVPADFIALSSEIDAALFPGAVVRTSALALARAAHGRTIGDAAADLRTQVESLLPATGGMAAVIIPNELLGTTFEWNTETQNYEASATPGAPANGVRFILYAMNPVTHQIVTPLNPVGRIDLLDMSTAGTDAVQILVVSDGTTYIDYTISLTETATGGVALVDGYLRGPDDRLLFDLQTTVTGSALALDYDLELEERNLLLDYTVNVGGGSVSLDFEVSGPNGEMTFTGGGDETTESYTIEVNGEPFATYTFDGETETFVGADGEPLTQAEQEVIGTAYLVTLYGFAVAQNLMSPIGLFF